LASRSGAEETDVMGAVKSGKAEDVGAFFGDEFRSVHYNILSRAVNKSIF
jgi:hypothetical protein